MSTKRIITLFFILLFFFSFLYIVNNTNQNHYYNTELLSNDELLNEDINTPKSGADISYLFKDPFKSNFDDIWQFFRSNFKANLDLQIDTYVREGNREGTTIIDDKIYPVDNLLLYKSLIKEDTDAYNTFNNYLNLRESPLWYEGNLNQYNYGFVRSVDNSTGEIFNDDRYLIDNLMPIFLLVENIGEEINSFTINGKFPEDSIKEIFYLINSSEFWDTSNSGFYNHNSTTNKYTESNLYAVLANLEINRLNINTEISNRALELANLTMKKLLTKVWDHPNGGFKYYSLNTWNTISDYKYLHVNALGIITLIEFWLETGMQNNTYIQYAKNLFNKLQNLWDFGFDAYEYSRDGVWDISGAIRKIDLEANAIMMSACLKLFEVTGNLTFYNRAWQLYNTFENDFYDNSYSSYRTSIDTPFNDNKNFHANLKLCEAYLFAFEIYNSTILKASYNVTESTPDFIFNQNKINITSMYAFEKIIKFYNTTTEQYESFISNYPINSVADITYLIKYPNDTLFETRQKQITSNYTTLLYNINESHPIGYGYFMYIYANTSKFSTAYTIKRFNVVSGLVNISIKGLPLTLYQGPTYNITLQINNTRKEDVLLNVSMEGDKIYNAIQTVNFKSYVLTNVSFNLTARLDATLGPQTLKFSLERDNILYLEIVKIINIGYSLDYADFLYQSRAIKGGTVQVFLKIINFLPNDSQYLNLSFSGDHLEHNILDEITLANNEIRSLYYNILLSDTILLNSTEIVMDIKKGTTIYYTKTFTINIIQKFEILSISFPKVVPQGEYANFIMLIQNSHDVSESFSLYINGQKVETNINALIPGENRITAQVLPTINPYDFQIKTFIIILKDSSDEIIAQFYFEVEIELTPFNLVIFYILPIIVPIGIVLFYKNKEIKHKLLRR